MINKTLILLYILQGGWDAVKEDRELDEMADNIDWSKVDSWEMHQYILYSWLLGLVIYIVMKILKKKYPNRFDHW